MYSNPIISLPFIILLLNLFFSPLLFAEEAIKPEEEQKTAPQTVEEQTPVVEEQTTFKSVEERRIYAVLQNERDNLEEERKVIALKEKELKTLQEEADKKLELLDKKLEELKDIQAKIEILLAEKDVKELKKTKDLSLIYAKMTPDRAAMAMATIDEQLAADLLANMKVKSAAKILDRMDKLKASQLSTTFTTIKVE
jgi:flagellar motility protein MotE (MotC chaperone)